MKKAAAAFLFLTVLAGASELRASESLKAIVNSYVQIQTQLASDKVDDLKGPARDIAGQAATMGKDGEALGKAANALEKATDLKTAREAFGNLTDAVMAAGKKENWKDVEGVKLAYCPMVRKPWLQKDAEIRNPYYGSGMLTCGEFKPLK